MTQTFCEESYLVTRVASMAETARPNNSLCSGRAESLQVLRRCFSAAAVDLIVQVNGEITNAHVAVITNISNKECIAACSIQIMFGITLYTVNTYCTLCCYVNFSGLLLITNLNQSSRSSEYTYFRTSVFGV